MKLILRKGNLRDTEIDGSYKGSNAYIDIDLLFLTGRMMAMLPQKKYNTTVKPVLCDLPRE